jgi:hypothetical protein
MKKPKKNVAREVTLGTPENKVTHPPETIKHKGYFFIAS